MLIRAGYRIGFDCLNPMPIHLLLSVHPDRRADLVTDDKLHTDARAEITRERDPLGNLATRVLAPGGLITFSTEFVVRDSGQPDRQAPGARQLPVEALPVDALPYLLPSRYCETDRLGDLAWRHFGGIAPGWARVQAICDYVHDRLTFGYHHARPTRTAAEGHDEQVGVCRDFAHLAVTLCRAMNIPARYCTGYLGDIGVPPAAAPMDFSAWFEAFLDGEWFTFDARHNVPRIGRIVVARGRDAADVAITHTFGQAILTRFEVITEEMEATTTEAGELDARMAAA